MPFPAILQMAVIERFNFSLEPSPNLNLQEPEAEHHKFFPVPSCHDTNRIHLFIPLFKPFSDTHQSRTQYFPSLKLSHTGLGDFRSTGFYDTPTPGPGGQKRRITSRTRSERYLLLGAQGRSKREPKGHSAVL